MNYAKCSTIMMLASMAITAMLSAKDEAGMRFTQLEIPNSPLITFRIILRAGATNDPKGKEGLNSLTAAMISQGGTKDLFER